MVKVLDCTFRDGGYYTNWDFDQKLADRYLDSVSKLPLDSVEVGYCNHPLKGYSGKYYFLTLAELNDIRARLAPDQKLAIMLNAKDCYPDRIPELVGNLAGTVDLIRMAVAPTNLAHGLALARAIKAVGIEPAINIMYLSQWVEDVTKVKEIAEGCGLLAAVSLVDSYGGCTPDQVGRATGELKAMLPGLPIGFHGHDNMGLAFANTLAAIKAGADYVDGTFVGMGRGAGNLRTELILIHNAAQANQQLDYDALSSVVEPFEKMQSQYGWGTNLAYMISGAANLPQGAVMDWLGRNRYSISSILWALQSQKGGAVDQAEHPSLTAGSVSAEAADELLIIGGGPSVKTHAAALKRYVEHVKPLVVHATIRHLDGLGRAESNQMVCWTGQSGLRIAADFPKERVCGFLVPPAPRFPDGFGKELGAPVFEVKPYVEENRGTALGPVSDIGPIALALGAAKSLGAKRILLAGFDGYTDASAAQQDLAREVQASLDAFRTEHPTVDLQSITPTLYDVPQGSLYSRIVETGA